MGLSAWTRSRRPSWLTLAIGGAAWLAAVHVVEAAMPWKAGSFDANVTVDVAVSLMLLGSVGFQMGVFYMVNSSDDDIREKSWQIISTTISIFSAVLIFQAMDNGLEVWFRVDSLPLWNVLVDLGHMALWSFSTQYYTAFICGAVGWEAPDHPDANAPLADHLVYEEVKERSEYNLQTVAKLLGHITAFATINGLGSVQQLFNFSIVLSSGAVALAAVFLIVSNMVRRTHRERLIAADGRKDEFEEMWDDSTEETENDVFGLAVSFLTVQVVKYAVSGCFADEEGDEGHCGRHTYKQVFWLMVLGLIFAAMTVLRSMLIDPVHQQGRIAEMIWQAVTMNFAWCLYFSLMWLLTSKLLPVQHVALVSVVVSLTASVCSCVVMIFLDYLADMDCTSDFVDDVLYSLVDSLGILIGFAWERSFDIAVSSIAESSWKYIPSTLTKLALALVLASIVTPAWRWYILPRAMECEKLDRQKKSARHEHIMVAHRKSVMNKLVLPNMLYTMREDAEEIDEPGSLESMGLQKSLLATRTATMRRRDRRARRTSRRRRSRSRSVPGSARESASGGMLFGHSATMPDSMQTLRQTSGSTSVAPSNHDGHGNCAENTLTDFDAEDLLETLEKSGQQLNDEVAQFNRSVEELRQVVVGLRAARGGHTRGVSDTGSAPAPPASPRRSSGGLALGGSFGSRHEAGVARRSSWGSSSAMEPSPATLFGGDELFDGSGAEASGPTMQLYDASASVARSVLALKTTLRAW